MAIGSTSGEADLPTSSAEERVQTGNTPPPGSIPALSEGDTVCGRFILQECVANGPTSQTFRAIDRRRQQSGQQNPEVALKVARTLPSKNSAAVVRLRHEADVLKDVRHPSLPRFIAIERDSQHVVLCREWLEGESLGSILDSRGKRPMTRVQGMHIIEGVCRALDYLHECGITHADVKPANILVTANGDATLLDLGSAIRPGTDEQTPPIRFTPEYASKAVLAGAVPTPADDLFSVACVAYRMLGGTRPFEPLNAQEAAAASIRPPCPENLSPAQWRALDRALSFDRVDRQPNIETFLAQLKGLRDDSATATDLSLVDAGPDWPSSADAEPGWPRYWPVAAALVIVLVGALLFVGREPDQPATTLPEKSPLASQRPTAAVPSLISPEREPPSGVTENLGRPPAATGSSDNRLLPDQPGMAATPTVLAPDRLTAGGAAPVTRAASPAPGGVSPSAKITPQQPPPTQTTATAPRAPKPQAPPPAIPSSSSAGGTPAADTSANRLAGPPAPTALSRVAPGNLTQPQSSTSATVSAPASASAVERSGATANVAAVERTVVPRRVTYSSLVVRRYVKPSFPRNSKSRRVAGWVDVEFSVDESGGTTDVRVLDAEPIGLFEEGTLSAVGRWRFAPQDPPAVVTSSVRLRFDPTVR